MPRTEIWSCGGGVQSTAIAVLILQGRLKRPEYAFITDTGRERESTWNYFWRVLKPEMLRIGLDIEVVYKDEWATNDLYGGEEGKTLLLPNFTNINGSVGRTPTFCSSKWKRDVAKRWMRKELGANHVSNWLGISTDEMKRVRASRELWCQHRYPLIFDIPMSRQQCIALVQDFGWPTPPRSSCWMCPHHDDNEWIDIRDNYPEDFASAVQLEREFRKTDPNAFLHKACVPLDEVEFGVSVPVVAEDGCSGMCYV